MSEIEIAPKEAVLPEIEIDDPIDHRPDITQFGIIEVERGVCEDNFVNRKLLRYAKYSWDPVFSTNGVPTGLIQARSIEQRAQLRMLSLAEKKTIMVDPNDVNSDYLTGLDLLAESTTDYLVPPWVIGATKMWVREQDTPMATETRKPGALPMRCSAHKTDSTRCMLWSSGRPKDSGLCRVHLGMLKRKPGDDVEIARKKVMQAAPYAVDILEELMTSAVSEPVKLKASTEILDRAGIRGGVEIDALVTVSDTRSAADIVMERLNKLAAGAAHAASQILKAEELIQDAVIVSIEEEV